MKFLASNRWRMCLAFASLATASVSAVAQPVSPLHVLLIVTDDMGWSDLGCQGNPVLRTPHIDALAEHGVRFTDAYAAAPVCSPTRASLMTGLAPARLHITQHGADRPHFWPDDRTIQPPPADHILPHEQITVAEHLKSAGYATGFFGKWHLSGTHVRKDDPATGGRAYFPDRHGFDINIGGCGYGGPPTYFDPYRIPTITPRRSGEYLTDRLADESIAWMRHNHDRPMFVCLWTYNPHYPFEAPAELIDEYRGKEGRGLKRAEYGAQIEATDRAIGRVLAALNELGVAHDTLVIFTSDNGGWDGATDNRPLRGGKGDIYEGGIRVPLFIRWPGVTTAGTTNSTPAISMDLTATILDAAGIESFDNIATDGQSLRRLLTGHPQADRPLFFHYPHFAWHKSNRPAAAVREGRHKLIRRFDDNSLELYDLHADFGEHNNLAPTHSDVASNLNAQLTAWLAATDAQLPTPRE